MGGACTRRPAVRDFEVLYECYVTEPFRQNGLVGYAPRGQLVLTWLTGERRRRLRSDAGD